MAMTNCVSLLDFQAAVSNNRSIIKTDGSGLTLLAMQPSAGCSTALVPTQMQARSDDGQRENAPCFRTGAVLGTMGIRHNANQRGLFRPESGAEQRMLILVVCFAFKHSC